MGTLLISYVTSLAHDNRNRNFHLAGCTTTRISQRSRRYERSGWRTPVLSGAAGRLFAKFGVQFLLLVDETKVVVFH